MKTNILWGLQPLESISKERKSPGVRGAAGLVKESLKVKTEPASDHRKTNSLCLVTDAQQLNIRKAHNKTTKRRDDSQLLL